MDYTLSHKQTPLSLEGSERINTPDIVELHSFCPNCKSFDTLMFSHGNLVSQRKHKQHNSNVYHDCGSASPCYLMI